MATHSSIPWRIPWIEEPGGLQSIGLQKSRTRLKRLSSSKQHVALVVKTLPANAEDTGSVPGSGRCPGEGNGNPFQYSCLKNFTDRGAWWTTVHGVAKRWT